jgi:hypothetical protein
MLPPPAHTKPYTPIARARSPGSGNRLTMSDSATPTPPRRRCPAPRAPHQQALRVRQPARQRRHREQRQAGEEHAPVAVQVAQPSAQQQAAAEGQHVGVDDPHQRRFGKAEVGADRRQRHVHDGRVEHDHQHAQAQHEQGPPALAVLRM